MTIEAKKIQLTQRLLGLSNIYVLDAVEHFLNNIEKNVQVTAYAEVPTTTDIEALKRNQSYEPMGFFGFMKTWDFDLWKDEPIEE